MLALSYSGERGIDGYTELGVTRQAANPLAITKRYRWFVIAGGNMLLALVAFAFVRAWMTGRLASEGLPPIVWAHLVIVLPAVPLGMWLFLHPKGTNSHRALGKLWLLLMITTAIVTLGVRTLNPGHLSFIHLFSVLVLVLGPLAYVRARQRNIASHSRILRGLFLGSLLVAGLATFAPGRIMWQWAFG